MLIEIDPLTGAVETDEFDPGTGRMVTTRRENVDGVLAANAESYNDAGQAWRGQKNDFWHVARIPLTTLYAWLQEFNAGKPVADALHSPFFPNADWERFLYARLNCSDYRKLKTAPVTI